MNAVQQFEGISGAIYVSIIAFSIVFAVLFGLTLMIYAMKFFAAEKDSSAPKGGTPAAPAAPAAAAPAAAAGGNPQGKIVAAITAAIIAATGGTGRIVSIARESVVGDSSWTRVWKTNGIMNLVSRRVATDRGWKR